MDIGLSIKVLAGVAAIYGAKKIATRLTSLFKHTPQKEQSINKAENNINFDINKLNKIFIEQNITDKNAKFHFIVIDPNNSQNIETHEKDLKIQRKW